jgi:hypothetical protein
MSGNFIYNGSFSLPDLSTNTSSLVTSLTAQQKQQLFWYTSPTTTLPLTHLVDGTGISNFPSPSLVGASQFIAMTEAVASINQDITIFNTGTYTLSFNHSQRNTFSTYNVLVSFAGTSIGVSAGTYNASSWSTFSNTYTVTTAGTLTLNIKYNTGTTTNWIAITNVSLTPLLLNTDLSYNNLKDTNVFGYLNVNDLNQNGVTTSSGYVSASQLLLNGIDVNQQLSTSLIDYNYTTIPTFTPSSIGYAYLRTRADELTITSTSSTSPTQIFNIAVSNPGTYIISYGLLGFSNVGSGFTGIAVTINSTNENTSNIQTRNFVNYLQASQNCSFSSSFVYDISNSATLYLVGWYSGNSFTLSSAIQSFQATRIA